MGAVHHGMEGENPLQRRRHPSLRFGVASPSSFAPTPDREEGAVIETPQNEGPGGSVPEPTDHEHDEGIEIPARHRAPR